MSLDHVGLVSLPHITRGNFNDAVQIALKRTAPRCVGFGCLDYRGSRSEGEGASQIRFLHAAGFSGLKLWIGKPKASVDFNITLEDKMICGALKAASDHDFPVLLHLADPPTFWEASGPYAHSDQYQHFDQWIERGLELFDRFVDIRFIGAHLLFLAGGIKRISTIMQDHHNLYLDTAPGRWFFRVLSEQSEAARNFFTRCKDRILLGSDALFFPDDVTPFSSVSDEENRSTFNRIYDFLFTKKTIEPPYPGTDTFPIVGLGLGKEVSDMIAGKNWHQIFPHQER